MTSALPLLWTCPRCGHQFVTRNLWHACTHYPLDHHFADKDPRIRRLFNRFLRLVRANGPVTVIPQKTRIALMTCVPSEKRPEAKRSGSPLTPPSASASQPARANPRSNTPSASLVGAF